MSVLNDYIITTIDNRGRNPKYLSKGKYPVIDNVLIKNTLYPNMEDVSRYLDQDQFDHFLRGYVHKNMPIITLVGNGIGNVTLAPSDKVAIVQNTIGFQVNDKMDEVFLYYYLLYSRERIRNFNRGSGQPSIRKTDILGMNVIAPSIEIQKKVSELLFAIDSKILINTQINKNLSHQLRLIFQHTFLDEEHPEWPVEKLGSFLSLERGLSYKGKFLSDSEGVPMVNLGNILPNSVFRPEKLKFYTGDFKAKVIVKPGDIVVANTDLTQAREVLGSAILIPDLDYPTIICSHHISIVRDCRISKHFIHGMLNSPSYRERVIGFATGTTVLALPSETILNCEFALPPNELIIKYDSIAESYYQKSEQLRKENQQLTQLRDTLLPQLMSGQLDVSAVSL